ncbi:hypothetical protein RSOLAG1IB_10711 [Rhizoctonia solani AG-1 IB]|uniref:Uncharacterized protein n=1 Tax=Thanatephorus cucumeris (strain AG1-IB / isolate 7/3/14) TaxID=1108050 RepID=A0A0B7G079_THACB|nr:hypothetical protein RSOLAG1IB_10711 [Rhizoctonia solani AG-1 IB]
MELEQSPGTLSDLGCPDLADECIKLIRTARIGVDPAPFRYDYGCGCFRIPAVALDICLLQRAGHSGQTLIQLQVEPETKPLLIPFRIST